MALARSRRAVVWVYARAPPAALPLSHRDHDRRDRAAKPLPIRHHRCQGGRCCRADIADPPLFHPLASNTQQLQGALPQVTRIRGVQVTFSTPAVKCKSAMWEEDR